MNLRMGLRHSGLVAVLALVLAGCAGGDAARQRESAIESRNRELEIPQESFFDLFRRRGDAEQVVAVNRYLWQASLDTLSFLPLEGADPFSGLIVTDWGRVAGDATAYRVTVYLNDPALDARSLKVAAFRQQGGRAVPVAEAENRRLEDAILTRARQLRIAQAGRRG